MDLITVVAGARYVCSRTSCQEVLVLEEGVAGLGHFSAARAADKLAAAAGWTAYRGSRQRYHYCPDCGPSAGGSTFLLWGQP